ERPIAPRNDGFGVNAACSGCSISGECSPVATLSIDPELKAHAPRTLTLVFYFDPRLRATRFRLAGALLLALALAGAAMRASTSEPLDFRRSAMRATSSSERMAGRPTESAIA